LNNSILKVPEHRLYKLPFRVGSKILDRCTLDAHSEFRAPKRGYLAVNVSKTAFTNGILTIIVKIEKEDAERVYIMVKDDHLLISCSTDTDSSYMSRHAYFCLDRFLWYYNERNFDEYYYPDFFDENGNSKYLISCKERGKFVIRFKKRYDNFFRPGMALPEVGSSVATRIPYPSPAMFCPEFSANEKVIGYCLLNPLNRNESEMYIEYPMLIPFTATLNLAGTALRSLTTYLIPVRDQLHPELSDSQYNLNDICSEMLKISSYYLKKQPDTISIDASDRKEILFTFWQEALPLLLEQQFVFYQNIYHLKYIKNKPVKKDINTCTISAAIPCLDFTLRDKGEYYIFELKFTLDKKRLNFTSSIIPRFFAASDCNPNLFYLLGSLAEAELVSFFARINFKMPILKAHYKEHFKTFVEQIRGIYGLREK